ncbi:MAG: transporter substrate-binding domain-containing protein, partial [Spirulinaceae cyanobacterium RM2_2_10]|nr:transporter substrate-binding domain-containing protein [Spirulinaceae cyanobacterium RM2_2_10]
LTATPSRARLVDFSRPYYFDGTGFVGRQGTIQRLGDLVNRRVLVLENSSTIAVVRHALPQVELVGVDSYQAALAQLEAGQAVAFAADQSLLAGWVQDNPSYQLLPTRLQVTGLAVALPRGLQYVELRREVNAAIARWQLSGWLTERREYWGLP